MEKTKTQKGMAKLFARIKRTNSAFKKMTRPEKRVAIAKDVVAALSYEAVSARVGGYLYTGEVEGSDTWRTNLDAADPDGSFQKLIPTLPQCNVCAKGAIFVCAVGRQNKVTNAEAANEIWDGDSLSRSLGGLFSKSQLDMIEAEFEGGPIYGAHNARMFNGSESDSERMIAIMKNIIKNKGTFKPTVHPDYETTE